MNSLISNTLVPLLCAVAFCGAGLMGLSTTSPDSDDGSDHEKELADSKKETETVQYSFPVYASSGKIGHCVLAVKANLRETEYPYADQARVETRHQVYQVASEIFKNVDDGHRACRALYNRMSGEIEVTEHVFLVN